MKKKKRNKIHCISSNECLHLKDSGGRESTILDRFLGEQQISISEQKGHSRNQQCLLLEEAEVHHEIFSLLQQEADHCQKRNTTLTITVGLVCSSFVVF